MRRALLVMLCLLAPRMVLADPNQKEGIDVTLHDAPPVRRFVAIEWNPVSLIIGKISANVIIVPVDHFGIVISPYYASTSTSPIYLYDDTANPLAPAPTSQAPKQTFTGGGTELGARYYFGRGGPRGFFLGPSFMVADFTATAANASTTQFLNLGFAADVGFQALVVDRLSLSLGVGVQYTFTDKTIPNQQFPADVYANAGFRPRALASIGFAL
jgi:hypothetical protein